VPLHSHTEFGTLILEQLQIVREEEVYPTRLTIAHVDRNPDHWLHLKAADTGAFCASMASAASNITLKAW